MKRTLFGYWLPRIRKALFDPGFWICEYSTDGINMKQEGSFAALGRAYDDAKLDAADFIQRNALINGTCLFKLRKPTLIERIRAI